MGKDPLHERLKLRRDDAFINLVEVKKENWSLGNGEAQYAPNQNHMQHPLPLPSNAPADLRVWLIKLDLKKSLTDATSNVLSTTELARANRFLRHEDAIRFATVRASLRKTLAQTLNTDPATLTIETDANGRPMLSIPNAPDFNVSHSGAYGLIAISQKRRVGIDIEEARPALDWRELEPAVFAQADRNVVYALPEVERGAAFFDCWSAKEAVLKARGEGIGGNGITLQGFSVLPDENGRFRLSKEAGAIEAAALDAPEGYAAALAWSTS